MCNLWYESFEFVLPHWPAHFDECESDCQVPKAKRCGSADVFTINPALLCPIFPTTYTRRTFFVFSFLLCVAAWWLFHEWPAELGWLGLEEEDRESRDVPLRWFSSSASESSTIPLPELPDVISKQTSSNSRLTPAHFKLSVSLSNRTNSRRNFK